ncbi:MAG: phosphoglycerate mutase family protein [Arcicella sp.]|nr:phosphoglycerate mutase family protein [Arcicella sp.]
MKNIFIFLLVLGFNFTVKCQTVTTFYLVRHAEKVTSDPSNKDPLLTENGQKRALFLVKKLKNKKLSAIYSTDFQRTKLTAKPIADKQKLEVQLYNPKQVKSWASTLLQENKGGKILIVGHSNTVLETIEALGGKRPFAEIMEQDYDYFFTVNIEEDGTMKVEFEHYGEKSSGVEGLQMMKQN